MKKLENIQIKTNQQTDILEKSEEKHDYCTTQILAQEAKANDIIQRNNKNKELFEELRALFEKEKKRLDNVFEEIEKDQDRLKNIINHEERIQRLIKKFEDICNLPIWNTDNISEINTKFKNLEIENQNLKEKLNKFEENNNNLSPFERSITNSQKTLTQNIDEYDYDIMFDNNLKNNSKS